MKLLWWNFEFINPSSLMKIYEKAEYLWFLSKVSRIFVKFIKFVFMAFDGFSRLLGFKFICSKTIICHVLIHLSVTKVWSNGTKNGTCSKKLAIKYLFFTIVIYVFTKSKICFTSNLICIQNIGLRFYNFIYHIAYNQKNSMQSSQSFL